MEGVVKEEAMVERVLGAVVAVATEEVGYSPHLELEAVAVEEVTEVAARVEVGRVVDLAEGRAEGWEVEARAVGLEVAMEVVGRVGAAMVLAAPHARCRRTGVLPYYSRVVHCIPHCGCWLVEA